MVDEASSGRAAASCYTGSIVKEGNTFDSETGSCDLTDCGLEFISCLGMSFVSVGFPHGDVVGFKDAITDNELALMSASSQQPMSISTKGQNHTSTSMGTSIFTSAAVPLRQEQVLLPGGNTLTSSKGSSTSS